MDSRDLPAAFLDHGTPRGRPGCLDVGRVRVLQETVAYHRREWESLVRDAEAVFGRYDGRPHWGKHHTKTAEAFAALYPEFETFREARADFDLD
ncbi:hypothetical protein BRC85_00425 [Halobacteriales archaeon QS_1_69_70]|nr:MAG: hypothetical protein BRC85_00425 [Halobacteriales archaeon QS_1_69_70]